MFTHEVVMPDIRFIFTGIHTCFDSSLVLDYVNLKANVDIFHDFGNGSHWFLFNFGHFLKELKELFEKFVCKFALILKVRLVHKGMYGFDEGKKVVDESLIKEWFT